MRQGAVDVDDCACEVEGWLLRLDVIQLPLIDAQMLFDVAHRKKSSADGIDGWGFQEF